VGFGQYWTLFCLANSSAPFAPDVISVRQAEVLPPASFRFHLAMDTLAVRLTVPTAKSVADFHRQVIAHAGRTRKDKRESVTPVYPTDDEDNKMKKDNLATLHDYDNNLLLSNLHLVISILLNIK
jgi:hypothetical protein